MQLVCIAGYCLNVSFNYMYFSLAARSLGVHTVNMTGLLKLYILLC